MWHAPVIVTPPAVEPILLAQAKQCLRLEEDETGFDACDCSGAHHSG